METGENILSLLGDLKDQTAALAQGLVQTGAGEMAIGQVILWICLGGFLGGAFSILIAVRVLKIGVTLDEVVLGFSRVMAQVSIAGLVGIGGAFAVALVVFVVTDGVFEDDVGNQFFMLAMSVVAGFGAKRLLPLVTQSLEKQVAKMADQVVKAAEVTQEAKEAAEVAEVMARANGVLAMGRKGRELDRSIADLEALAPGTDPKREREVVILLGRSQRAAGDLPGAINTLDAYIAKKEGAEETDEYYADALYNAACYHALQAQEKTGAEAEGAFNAAIENLEKATKTTPDLVAEAAADQDLDIVARTPLFEELRAKVS